QVDVVGVPSAGHHRVELLARLLAGGQAVGDVDRHPLGGVHGGGVPELDVGRDVVGRQGDLAAGAGVLQDQGAGVGGVEHGPPVTVLDPVGRCGLQAPVVAAGDDGVPDRGVVAVGQGDLVGGAGG